MRIPVIFEEKKKANKPVLSFEIFPPKKDAALQNIDETLALMCDLKPDFISVTFGAGGSTVDNKTVEIAKKIKKEYNIEPLVHLTCLHYGKKELEEILKQLEDAGIENVLALRGDINPDIPMKHDFKYANELVSYVKSRGNFSVSGACYPETHLEAPDAITDIRNLKRKVDDGAEHLVSQLFFDNDVFYRFYEKTRIAGINVPVDAGVMPVTNRAQIERMVNMCGASLPVKFQKVLQKYENNKEALLDAGIAYTINQIVDLIANEVDGVHIYTMNNPAVAKRICDGIRNLV
ncbi:MAG: methylenetetrahydrofolate reductase [Lachnospiraceae bacterium]|nr:methylenetetrahydrofolate reductase [NAD(P)H] [Lachnospiraceae bacterium]MBQ8877565.1 methylenetetrahydrofolate reductase [NAD(P)H] [Lachnospiraceae bacterium]